MKVRNTILTIAAAVLVAVPLTLLAQDDEKPAAVEPGPEYRKFTSKTGKVLLAKVVNRIDDDTYTMEFWLVRGLKTKCVKTLSGVYWGLSTKEISTGRWSWPVSTPPPSLALPCGSERPASSPTYI